MCFKKKLIITLLSLLEIVISCQSLKTTLNSNSNSKFNTDILNPQSLKVMSEESLNIQNQLKNWNCHDPSFSYSGDQLIYWCQFPNRNQQSQIFTKDLNSNLTEQISYINGRIENPQIIKSHLFVFASDTDRKKEILSLNPADLEKENLFEIYMYNQTEDEVTRLTNNEFYDGLVFPYKHIDPKIIFLRKTEKQNQIILKNLKTFSEKILFITENKISELSVNENNQILLVEELPNKKWVRWIKSEDEQFVWPEFSKNKFNFSLLADTTQLQFLEGGPNGTAVKVFNSSLQCEYEIFSFPNIFVSQFKKSPLNDQTYVWVETSNMIKRIQLSTLNFNPSASCKKLTKRGK